MPRSCATSPRAISAWSCSVSVSPLRSCSLPWAFSPFSTRTPSWPWPGRLERSALVSSSALFPRERWKQWRRRWGMSRAGFSSTGRNDRELAASFSTERSAAGYGALVVTLDTYLLSWRERDLQNAYLPFLRGEGLANYFSDPVFRAALGVPPEQDPRPAIEHFGKVYSSTASPGPTWHSCANIPDCRFCSRASSTRRTRKGAGSWHGGDHRLQSWRPPA